LRNKGDVTFAINPRKVWKFISMERIYASCSIPHEPNYKLFEKKEKRKLGVNYIYLRKEYLIFMYILIDEA
jgi:hypothetical protein